MSQQASASKSELIAALEQIEREKGIKKDEILKMIEGAMISSLRKHVGKNAIIEASIDPKTAEFSAHVVKKVVEAITDPEMEMSLESAKRYKKDAAIGDDIRLPAPAADFARIAAQTAKQVLVQKIREVERESLYEEFKPKEGEVVTGNVHRFMDRNIIVDLGKTEAILPLREQIRRERYGVGSRVRAVILKVDLLQRGPQVVLSRAAPLFLRRLFEMEIPEISDKIVEIVEIVREPGFRAKVVVKSNDSKIDPVGSCVGLRGSRVRSITNELSGERIDLIPYSADINTFIGNTLSPAKVSSVRILDMQARRAEIIVPNEQLSLAIGKDGQNVRLACRLTGWTLEVKSESQKGEEVQAKHEETAEGLSSLEGIGPKTAELLVKGGMTDIRKLAECKPEDLMTLQGIGEKTAAKIIAAAQKAVAAQPAAPSPAPAPEPEQEGGNEKPA
jgi:transcription termination/antitermination protein NusA